MEINEVIRPRRVVTGLREDGTSYLARVEAVEQVDYSYALPRPPATAGHSPQPRATEGGYGFYRMWGSDRLPVPLPNDGRTAFFDSEPTPDETPEALRKAGVLPPPLGFRIGWTKSPSRPAPPGAFHWTDTIDLLFMLSGARREILEDGALVQCAGDLVVQNGTVHARESVGTDPTVMAYVVVGALGTGPHPPLDRMLAPHRNNPQGPVGGHRLGEYRGRPPLDPWHHPPGPPAGSYSKQPLRGPTRIKDMVAPRRLVTGTNPDGRSDFARAERIDEVDYSALGLSRGHRRLWRLWQIDRLPQLLPTDGRAAPLDSKPSARATPTALRRAPLLPGPLGVVLTLAEINPTAEPGQTSWHDSMDACFIVSGKVVHRLDGGEEIELGPGDVLIQNGTNHAWHNRGRVPAMVFTASFGGARFGQTPPPETRDPLRR